MRQRFEGYIDAAAWRGRTEKGGHFVVPENWFPSVVYVVAPCRMAERRREAEREDKRKEKMENRLPAGTSKRNGERTGAKGKSGVTSFPINNKQIGHYPKSMPTNNPVTKIGEKRECYYFRNPPRPAPPYPALPRQAATFTTGAIARTNHREKNSSGKKI